MVTYFSGVVQAPITVFVIVTEMTNNQSMVVPLIASALIAQAISRILCPEGIYHALAKGFLQAHTARVSASQCSLRAHQAGSAPAALEP
ncbi:chloride channel protein [Bradyrhizobium sp. 143]|nr:chloride channel protein [Bradyrhizobium sp. 143]MCK1728312.1 chloride channel protein [Bradyrhizobium sp. 142]